MRNPCLLRNSNGQIGTVGVFLSVCPRARLKTSSLVDVIPFDRLFLNSYQTNFISLERLFPIGLNCPLVSRTPILLPGEPRGRINPCFHCGQTVATVLILSAPACVPSLWSFVKYMILVPNTRQLVLETSPIFHARNLRLPLQVT